MITPAQKVQLFPFSEPFLVLQSPGTSSIPPVSFAAAFHFRVVGLLQHYCFVLFFICPLLNTKLSTPTQTVPFQESALQSGHANGSGRIMQWLEPLWSRPSPRSPVTAEHQTSLTEEGAFRLRFQQANSHSSVKTSQTG